MTRVLANREIPTLGDQTTRLLLPFLSSPAQITFKKEHR